VTNKAIAECVTDVLNTFLRPLWSIYWTDARQDGIYLFYIIKKQASTAFLFQNLTRLLESLQFAPFGEHEKKPFDVICCLYKMKQFHCLLCITRNYDWSRNITTLSNLTRMTSREIKAYSESRIKLRNL